MSAALRNARKEIRQPRLHIYPLVDATTDQRHTARGLAQVVFVERSGRDDHEIDRDRLVHPPTGDGPRRVGTADRILAETGAVGDDLQAARGAHGPAHGCLVARMIDTGNPVTPTVRPIVREGRPTPGRVIPDDETVGDRATVADGYSERVGRRGRQRYADGTAVAAESCRSLVDQYAVHSQAQEVEHQRVGPGGSPNGEHGAPLDAVATVRQIHRQRVIQHVDPWTVRPWNGGGLLGREPTGGEQRDDHDAQRVHGGANGHPIAASASCISAAVWYRSTGSFAIARRITCASASGTS